MKKLYLALPLLVLALNCQAASKEIDLEMPGGSKATVNVTLPPDFDSAKTYSVLVGPGDWYWRDTPAQPGWIIVNGDPFFDEQRLAHAPVIMDWLRKSYRVRGNKFHMACWSANSAGAFEIVQKHSSYFHSVTGLAGMPGEVSADDLKALAGVRVQFIVGQNDSYWKKGSEGWHQRFLDAGIQSTLEIVPNGEHVMPEIKGKPIFDRLDAIATEVASKASSD